MELVLKTYKVDKIHVLRPIDHSKLKNENVNDRDISKNCDVNSIPRAFTPLHFLFL